MQTTFLSAKDYLDPSKNNGDCILVDNGLELVIFDCGCEEHAKRAIQYMDEHGYSTAKLVLSHNDADHFDGIPYLIEQEKLSEVYTLLLFKYVDQLFRDGRQTPNSIREKIKEYYDNIFSLGKKVTLKDIFEDTDVAVGVTILGPSKEYALDAVAKLFDSREGDTIDKETIVNAVSTQLSISFGGLKKLLLTGDSSFEALEENLKGHSAIQLPHHGKLLQAEKIFEAKNNSTVYFVSDNTGNSNGGSDDLMKKYKRGHIIYNTKNGDQTSNSSTFGVATPTGAYFWGIV